MIAATHPQRENPQIHATASDARGFHLLIDGKRVARAMVARTEAGWFIQQTERCS
jgi:hypothetical protein